MLSLISCLSGLTETECHTECKLSGRRICVRSVNSGGDSGRGDHRGVLACVFGECEEILGRQVESQFVHDFAVLEVEGVTECPVVELEVVFR